MSHLLCLSSSSRDDATYSRRAAAQVLDKLRLSHRRSPVIPGASLGRRFAKDLVAARPSADGLTAA